MTADRIVSRALWAARRLELPLPNMNTNACELLQCPIQANVPQTYRYILPISRVFPSVSSDATFSLSLSLEAMKSVKDLGYHDHYLILLLLHRKTELFVSASEFTYKVK